MGFQKNNMRNRFKKIFFCIGDFLSFLNICKIAWINKCKNKFSKKLIKRQEYTLKHLIYTLFSRLKKKSLKFCSFKRRTFLIKKIDNPDRNLDCRSKSEKAGFRSKIFDRDQTFSDFDPERIAIGGRIGNRIETISNSTKIIIKNFNRFLIKVEYITVKKTKYVVNKCTL